MYLFIFHYWFLIVFNILGSKSGFLPQKWGQNALIFDKTVQLCIRYMHTWLGLLLVSRWRWCVWRCWRPLWCSRAWTVECGGSHGDDVCRRMFSSLKSSLSNRLRAEIPDVTADKREIIERSPSGRPTPVWRETWGRWFIVLCYHSDCIDLHPTLVLLLESHLQQSDNCNHTGLGQKATQTSRCGRLSEEQIRECDSKQVEPEPGNRWEVRSGIVGGEQVLKQ